MTKAIRDTNLPFPLFRKGKVRDVYDLGDALLMVATDRVSAFDVVMPEAIPRKGEVLTQISAWWFGQLANVVHSHLISVSPDAIINAYPALKESRNEWAHRATLVRRTEPFPIECVIRGYLSGSAWAEYRRAGTLAGEPLASGLKESDRLNEPIFSPATKAESGHDENITFDQVVEALGQNTAERLRELSLSIYNFGRDEAAKRGIIIADTKFEFGVGDNGEILLIDEVLTPDSSRFWPADQYAPGGPQPSFDKQPLRDHLEALFAKGEWNKAAPGPSLPATVVQTTSERYMDAFKRITGRSLDEYEKENDA